MALTHIPYRKTGYFSSLICDLIDGHPALADRQSHSVDLAAFKKQIETKGAQFPSSCRTTLVSELKLQYQELDQHEAVEKHIELLKSPTTFTVTTGHQLNLFTGPLYFIYKIISAIKLTQQLKDRYPQYDFVPIYWMASEDHDFEEISFFHFKGKKFKWNKENNGAVGRMALNELTPLLDTIRTRVGRP